MSIQFDSLAFWLTNMMPNTLLLDNLLECYRIENPEAEIPSTIICKIGLAVMLYHMPSVNLSYPDMQLIHSDPPIFVINNFFSKKLCDQTINYALNGRGLQMGRSKMNGSVTTIRSSTSWFLQRIDVKELLQQAEALLGCTLLHFEVYLKR